MSAGVGFYTPPTEDMSVNDPSSYDLTNKAKIKYEFVETKDDLIRNITSESLILSDENEELDAQTGYKLEELD